MTRKKFVKQLMALGYQRNDAEGLAIYARCGRWTYEQYLQVEKRSARCRSAMLDIQFSLVNLLTPAVEAATEAIKQLRMSLTDKGWRFAAENLAAIATEAAQQIHKQHPADALAALTYSCGIDLANGPDMTGYMPQGGGKV